MRAAHYVAGNGEQQPEVKRLDELFAAEPDGSAASVDLAGIHFDWSKTHLDDGLIGTFAERAKRMNFAAARDALFSGGIVNPSEGRAATHVAERGSGAPDDVDLAAARRQRTRALVDAIEAGAFGNVAGYSTSGSGARCWGRRCWLTRSAGGGPGSTSSSCRTSTAKHSRRRSSMLDPATTLVVVASKTFTTAETLANMDSAINWLKAAGVADPYGRLIAVTANAEAAVEAGIDETRVLLSARASAAAIRCGARLA